MCQLLPRVILRSKSVAFKATRFFILASLCWASIASLASEPSLWNAALANNQTTWTDEKGQALHLSDFSNKPVILTMAYSQCKKTCPLVTMKELKEIQKILEEKKIAADFFVITLDPEHDTKDELLHFKKKVGVDRPNWHFIRADSKETRELAANIGLGNYWSMDDHIQHQYKILYFNPNQKIVRTLNWDRPRAAELFD